MKVLMCGRFDLFEKPGGDTVQIKNTATELQKLGAEVDICTSSDRDFSAYDLIHIFQLDWIPEIYFFVKKAKDSQKKIVFSPIHHNIYEVKKFDDIYAFDFRRISRILFKDQFKRDTFKNLYRSVFDSRRLGPTLFSVLNGFKNMQRQILQWSDVVLVQTELEASDLKKTFGVENTWVKVPNGVGENYLDVSDLTNPLDINDYVICVGRVEPRKNQLSIIEAMKKFREETKSDVSLVLIGYLGERKHFEYSGKFKKELEKNKWIKHITKVPYDRMPAYYKFSKVGVSASWFETTGLTSIEALFCGANAVASGERARECLGNYASYCCPDNIDSIKEAIITQYYLPRPVVDPELRKIYTWKNAAEKTLNAYNNLLGKI